MLGLASWANSLRRIPGKVFPSYFKKRHLRAYWFSDALSILACPITSQVDNLNATFLECIGKKRMPMALLWILFTAHEGQANLAALVGHVTDLPTKS